MKHTLMELPYKKNALEPYMCEETVTYHYEKHHAWYVKKLNNLIEWTEFEDMKLEDIIKKSEGKIYNNAAQVWNHNEFWKNFSDKAPTEPSDKMMKLLEDNFWDYESFKKEFQEKALNRFGSGWAWLVQKDNKLEIYSTPNAENPLTEGGNMLITIDVWEHAYYLDTRNDRAKYVENFWKILDWDNIEIRLK